MPSPKNYTPAKLPLTGDELFIVSQLDPLTNTHITVKVSLNDILGPLSPFIKKVKTDTSLMIKTTADEVRTETNNSIKVVSTALGDMGTSSSDTMTTIQSKIDAVKRDLASNSASLSTAISKAVANVVTKDTTAPATVFRYTANLAFGGAVTVGKQTKTFPVAGVRPGDAILLTPRGALPSAFMLGEAVCLTNDVLQVTLFSTTLLTVGNNSISFDVVCFR